MFPTSVRRAGVLLLAAASMAGAQAAPAQPEPGPKVGDVAPGFSLGGATREGVLKAPVSLAQFKGQTVVVAFFPKARTTGCTAQMTTYRDQWASLFNGGKGIHVIAISMDADTTQANWAREANLPMTFASDVKGDAGKAYGAYPWREGMENRLLFVVAPDGRIAYTAKPFKPLSADAYTELGAALKKTSGVK
ncbi:MAG: redoxin domain-containing protein [Gemmatimonadetes bacterium]|nr:redoxin domain-containing protein [Gemmatimonadota bacterium]MBI3568617.1 redoxin domain-containing protein [Gemmatimonadota bacterium]